MGEMLTKRNHNGISLEEGKNADAANSIKNHCVVFDVMAKATSISYPDVAESNSLLCKRSSGGYCEDQKSTYGRLRVLTAPPSVHDGIGNGISTETAFQHDHDASAFFLDVENGGEILGTVQRAVGGIQPRNQNILQNSNSVGNQLICGVSQTTIPTFNKRSATSTNLRPGSGTGSSQRLNTGGTTRGSGGDHSVTQFALIDDENVSALQQVTKGGGALTLASQWKSQFDDSEDTTDNEWKQEPQSPDHKLGQSGPQSQSNLEKNGTKFQNQITESVKVTSMDFLDTKEAAKPKQPQFKKKKRKKYNLNITGLENYLNLQEIIPHCWSEPAMGNVLRRDLEPPLLQQAAFDDTIYRMDIIRNVCTREIFSRPASSLNTTAPVPFVSVKKEANEAPHPSALNRHRNSLPNVALSNAFIEDRIKLFKSNEVFQQQSDDQIKVVPWRAETTSTQKITMPATNAPDGQLKQQNCFQFLPGTNNAGSEETEINDEGCVSGHLEIRVIPQENSNPEESIYYDALAAIGGIGTGNIRTGGKNTTDYANKTNEIITSQDVNLGKSKILQNKCSNRCNKNINDILNIVPSTPTFKSEFVDSHHKTSVSFINIIDASSQTNDANKKNEENTKVPIICDFSEKEKNSKSDFLSNTDDYFKNPPSGLPPSSNLVSSKSQAAILKLNTKNFNNLEIEDLQTSNLNLEDSNQMTNSSHGGTNHSSSSGGGIGIGCFNASSVTSKIPVLNPNLRQSKCASWAGCDATSISTMPFGTTLSSTGKHDKNAIDNNIDANESKVDCISVPMTDFTDTQALRRKRESEDKYVTDPTQLNLRFARPLSINSNRTRLIPSLKLGQDNASADNNEEQSFNTQVRKGGKQCTNDYDVGSTTYTASVMDSSTQKKEPVLSQSKYNEEELLCNIVKDLSSVDNATRSDITPPPGAPKVENSARLRRYRHNID